MSSETGPRTDHRLHWGNVLNSLQEGDLDLFADYLAETQGAIDPCIARYLVKMIRGSKSQTGLRLEITNHPDKVGNEVTQEEWYRLWHRDWRMARFVAVRRGFERSLAKAAFQDAAEKFGLSINHIRRRVAPFKDRAIAWASRLEAVQRQSRTLPPQRRYEKPLPVEHKTHS